MIIYLNVFNIIIIVFNIISILILLNNTVKNEIKYLKFYEDKFTLEEKEFLNNRGVEFEEFNETFGKHIININIIKHFKNFGIDKANLLKDYILGDELFLIDDIDCSILLNIILLFGFTERKLKTALSRIDIHETNIYDGIRELRLKSRKERLVDY